LAFFPDVGEVIPTSWLVELFMTELSYCFCLTGGVIPSVTLAVFSLVYTLKSYFVQVLKLKKFNFLAEGDRKGGGRQISNIKTVSLQGSQLTSW
jgi:hypothetical protein